ncbi:zinc carboxypeptidase-like [Trichoplusia ni]|uniref:Zinc carboxypeptidase-like n=1 Tax=Trichoplusia ni TaxID=7111 RepID=A0A7E5WQJ8_TRINI|nr:zinc carboxypeptidase-like [Trichoplusia ni]
MLLKNVLIILVIVYTIDAVKKSYDGYKLYQIVPKDEREVDILNDVYYSNLGEFWVEYFKAKDDVKVMVSPKNLEKFQEVLRVGNVEAKEIIGDVQKVINDQLKPATSRASDTYLSYSWSAYHDLDAIYKWLDELETNHTEVKTVVMGKSLENRDIKGIIINYHPEINKPIGMIEGTLHAREWISAATVTWFIKEFLTSTDPQIRALAENFEWHVFPVVNPDGYVYTFTDNRMWRKNRSPASAKTCAEGVDDDMSHGVDLNRNFDFEWATVGASNDSCTNTYAGPSPASEPETKAIAEYALSLKNKGNFMYYLSYHSYTQLIIVPYSHVQSDGALLSGNYGDMFEIAVRGSDAMRRRNGTEYRVGLSVHVLYPMSGSSFDWVKYYTNVPISYLIELRDLGEYGFLLPPEQIIPTALENMDGLIEMDRTARSLRYYAHTSGASRVLVSAVVVAFGIVMSLLG